MATQGELVSVNIKLTAEQRDFIRGRYGNLSRWVRTEIDQEMGADRLKEELKQKAKQSNTYVWTPGQNNRGQTAPK